MALIYVGSASDVSTKCRPKPNILTILGVCRLFLLLLHKQCPITTVHIKLVVQAIKELFKIYGSLGCPAPADASTAQLLYSRLRSIMEDGAERLQEPEDQKIYCVF